MLPCRQLSGLCIKMLGIAEAKLKCPMMAENLNLFGFIWPGKGPLKSMIITLKLFSLLVTLVSHCIIVRLIYSWRPLNLL